MSEVVAIGVSDLHLSHRPPSARAGEPDWFAAMERQLKQLRDLAALHNVPVLCGGDVFDDGWRPQRCPPELINFALAALPDGMLAVPGQHDLPHHRLEDLRKSAFWTLVRAGKIRLLDSYKPTEVGPLSVYGFAWGVGPRAPAKRPNLALHVAVAHRYVWTRDSGYEGAPDRDRLGNVRSLFAGHDVVLLGDNHTPFLARGEPTFVNPGSFFRRRSDEESRRPWAALVRMDGSVERHYFDVIRDAFTAAGPSRPAPGRLDARDFFAELRRLGDSPLDFSQALKRLLDDPGLADGVKAVITRAMQEG